MRRAIRTVDLSTFQTSFSSVPDKKGVFVFIGYMLIFLLIADPVTDIDGLKS